MDRPYNHYHRPILDAAWLCSGPKQIEGQRWLRKYSGLQRRHIGPKQKTKLQGRNRAGRCRETLGDRDAYICDNHKLGNQAVALKQSHWHISESRPDRGSAMSSQNYEAFVPLPPDIRFSAKNHRIKTAQIRRLNMRRNRSDRSKPETHYSIGLPSSRLAHWWPSWPNRICAPARRRWSRNSIVLSPASRSTTAFCRIIRSRLRSV